MSGRLLRCFGCLCHSLPWLLPLLQFRIFVCRLVPPHPLASPSLVCGPSPGSPSSPVHPSLLAPGCHPSPLAESSLLRCSSQIAEACCAFKESRLLAVTHFWLSARKIAAAWLTEKKTNNFSFVWGYFLLAPPFLLSFQDLNANGGLKPVDTFGFRSLVRPPALRLFLILSLGFCSNMDEGVRWSLPPSPPFLRHP